MQQGCFLCPGDLSKTSGFENNLMQQLVMGIDPEYFFPVWNPPQVYRLTIPGELRGQVLQELRRMNISRESLIPDLDGFAARSKLNWELAGGDEPTRGIQPES